MRFKQSSEKATPHPCLLYCLVLLNYYWMHGIVIILFEHNTVFYLTNLQTQNIQKIIFQRKLKSGTSYACATGQQPWGNNFLSWIPFVNVNLSPQLICIYTFIFFKICNYVCLWPQQLHTFHLFIVSFIFIVYLNSFIFVLFFPCWNVLLLLPRWSNSPQGSN